MGKLNRKQEVRGLYFIERINVNPSKNAYSKIVRKNEREEKDVKGWFACVRVCLCTSLTYKPCIFLPYNIHAQVSPGDINM